MKLNALVYKLLSKDFSVTEAVDLLADQEHVPDVSHIHMHLRDGFAMYAKPQFTEGPNGARDFYAEAHMTSPERAAALKAQGAHSLELWDGSGIPSKNRFQLRTTRMAEKLAASPTHKSKYDIRSGIAEKPEVPETGHLTAHYQRYDQVGKKMLTSPVAGTPSHAIAGGVNNVNVAVSNAGLPKEVPMPPGGAWNKGKSLNTAAVRYIYTVQSAKVPRLKGSEKHTMFEDSEAMAMHLCAALRSEAGVEAIKLLNQKNTNDTTTVGVFSKTAVQQVNSHIKKSSGPKDDSRVIERTTDLRPGAQRTQADPNPTGDTYSRVKKDIDHIVLVMGKRANGALNIVTFYPSADTTAATIQADNTGDIDLLEPEFGGRKITYPTFVGDMKLKW